MKQTQRQSQQEQEQPPQRKGPPAGWRYYAQAKHRSRFRGWLAQVWRGAKNNAALVSLVGVMLTLLVTIVLTQQGWVRQQRLENQRAQAAASVAEQQAQQEALQTYLDQMNTLLLEKNLRESGEGSEVRTLARAKTLTVLLGLDAQSKRILLQFLVEAELVQSVEERGALISLGGADLSDADLSGADLDSADLSDADLSGADLRGADLAWSFLRETDLKGANLQGANLSGDVDLSDANLEGANLEGANLKGAGGVTDQQLAAARSLEGATMPNGQKYEDWLKSRGREEDGGNGGSS